jgi:hypothetical protein
MALTIVPSQSSGISARPPVNGAASVPYPAERDFANSRPLIGAYERARQDGINAQQFVALYNEGKILPEVRARLGRRGEVKDYRRFYDTWLKPYAPAGLAGTAGPVA